MHSLKSQRGFTLMELLVVIAIIGILSSVVLASLNQARQKARDSKRISDIKQLQLALELHFESNGYEYPDSLSALSPTFLQVIPNDPITLDPYPYENYTDATRADCAVATGECAYYHIGALLETNNRTALETDADLNNKIGSGPDGQSNQAACGTSAATLEEDRCYDVTP